MRAIRFHEYGPPAALVLDEVPSPHTGPGQALVRVQACGVNPLDARVLAGAVRELMPRPLPAILGWDLAGVVQSSHGRHRPGTRVAALLDYRGDGAYAEQIAVDEALLVAVPDGLAPSRVAGAITPGLTARLIVDEHLLPARPARVLILGAAGSVGRLVAQLLRSHGMEVIGLVRRDQLDLPQPAGLSAAIALDVLAAAASFDAVVDLVGGATRQAAVSRLRPGGTLVSTVVPPSRADQEAGVRATMVMVGPHPQRLASLMTQLAEDEIAAPAATDVPLAAAAELHGQMLRGTAPAKAVLVPGLP